MIAECGGQREAGGFQQIEHGIVESRGCLPDGEVFKALVFGHDWECSVIFHFHSSIFHHLFSIASLHDLLQAEAVDVGLHLQPDGEVVAELVTEFFAGVVFAGEEFFDVGVVEEEIEGSAAVGEVFGDGGEVEDLVEAGVAAEIGAADDAVADFELDEGFGEFEAAAAEGEGAWRLPMGQGYDDRLKSRLADMVNSCGRDGGSITAAQFLKRFVKDDMPWCHLDIAGTALLKSDSTLAPKGATGWGVMALNRMIRDMFEGK